MEKKDAKIIEEIACDLLEKMNFDCSVEIKDVDESEFDVAVCNILVKDGSNLLIGQHGVNLDSLQHLIRFLVSRKTDKMIRFIVDVNSYRQEKNQSILEYARSLAAQAVSERRAVVMRPMNAYERRLVHMELKKDEKIVTESSGDGEERKVIVKPASDII